MSDKLSITKVQNRLVEADNTKKATYKKMQLSTRKHGKFTPKDPSTRLTHITQVEIPSDEKVSDRKNTSGIPQADIASDYIDSYNKIGMGKGMKKTNETKTVTAKSLTPNQTMKNKEVRNAVKNTSDASPAKTMLPQADYADKYEKKMPKGTISFNSKGDKQGKQSYDKLNATTRPTGKEVTVKFDKKADKSVTQVSMTKGSVSNPSDAPKKPTWSKVKSNSTNLIESGIVVKLNGKVKNKFDIVSRNVLTALSEQYKNVGYELVFERTNDVAWKKDNEFMKTLKNSIDAKYNFNLKESKKLRKDALDRFHNLCKPSYNSLYESRTAFAETIMEAFKKIEEKMDKMYVDSLELFNGMVRIVEGEDVADIEIVTEATGPQMALRQIRDTILENYGLDTEIKHIFIDGKKFKPEDVKEWRAKK